MLQWREQSKGLGRQPRFQRALDGRAAILRNRGGLFISVVILPCVGWRFFIPGGISGDLFDERPAMHEINVVGFLANLTVILLSAKIFGEVAERLGQPPVLGELLGGVVLGFGLFNFFHPEDPALTLMAEFGVILLLFETGINSDLSQLLKAGPASLAVACVGVVAPFVLGYALMSVLGYGGMQAVFVGAALTATSVGITARVLADMGKLNIPEAQIILGAAVIDDILGIIILSAVQGVALSGVLSWPSVARSTLFAAGFLSVALWLGPRISQFLVGMVQRMRVRGILIVSAVIFAFITALAAHAVGTALIVGAFTAGVLLARTDKREDIDGALKPVADIFVPIFFVMVGAKVQLGAYNPLVTGNHKMILLALSMVLLAVIGKVVSGWAARGRGLNQLGIGVGMIPRGEVGLIFAQIGLASGVIGAPLYAAVVGMVVLTTFLAPPLLTRAFKEG
ncbi:MAG: cation:proton antiporter [Elusimicrobia bacterium]|nr:cation:proton antiporter [Elusimicrobiota bacterium]